MTAPPRDQYEGTSRSDGERNSVDGIRTGRPETDNKMPDTRVDPKIGLADPMTSHKNERHRDQMVRVC